MVLTASKTENYPPSGDVKDADLEKINCPLCTSQEMTTVHRFTPFRIVQCKDCGLKYLNPRLKESVMEALYKEDTYFSGGSTGYEEYRTQEKSLRITFSQETRYDIGQAP
jgi:transcription elongation factor Elf1